MLGHVRGKLAKPDPESTDDPRKPLPLSVDPGVGPHHEAVREPKEERAPGRIKGSTRGHIKAKGELDPEGLVALQESSNRVSGGAHPSVGPEDGDLRLQLKKFLNGHVVSVGVEKEPLAGRHAVDPNDDGRGRVSRPQVEFADSPVDPPLEPFFHVVQNGRISRPGRNVRVGAVGMEEGDDASGGRFVKEKGPVVGGARDESSVDTCPVQDEEDGLRAQTFPGGPIVVDVGVEDGEVLGKRRTCK